MPKKLTKQSKECVKTTAKYKHTLVVNLLAGPGAGKSTMAASVFAALKWMDIDCELALEYAKDLVWEKRHKTFENQVYIFGKQHNRIFRLLGQVEVIITDSPLYLTPIYDTKNQFLKQLAFYEASKCNNLNILLARKKAYNPNGRNHNKSQAIEIDQQIRELLTTNNIPFVEAYGDAEGVELVVARVLGSLAGWDRN